MGQAEVPAHIARTDPPHTSAERIVIDFWLNHWQEAIRVQRRVIADIGGQTVQCTGAAAAPVEQTVRIKCQGINRDFRIDGELPILCSGLTDQVIDTVAKARVRARTVGPVTTPCFGSQVDESIVFQWQRIEHIGLAHRPIALRCATITDRGPAVMAIAFEDDVDDPGNGVRAILGGSPVTQHLDALNRAQGNGVDVHARGAPAHRDVDVQQGTLVQSLAVDQH